MQLAKMLVVSMKQEKWDYKKYEKNKKKNVKISEFLLIVIRNARGRGRKKP